VEELEKLTKKKRSVRLNAINAACQMYIDTKLRIELDAFAKEAMEAAGKDPTTIRIILDEEDNDRQSLLIHYPSVIEESGYVTPSVKIESGAKSALDPHSAKAITPYLGLDLPDANALAINSVMTIHPERTFLDKVLILDGMTFYFGEKGVLRGNGRMSRHYYDVHQLMAVSIGAKACGDKSLIEDCVRHARMFFYRSNTGLDLADCGSFPLSPTGAMGDALARDYDAMSTMIFGEVPSFQAVLDSVASVEERLNAG
jgi:Nucleotidyl transferase AbiEii toxin, Type IV TA system